MYSQQNWLRYGIMYSEVDFRRLQTFKRIKAISILLTMCLLIYGLSDAIQTYRQLGITTTLSESYLKVVLGVMNGEVRMVVGNEMFECKGGYLGRVR